MEEPKESLEDGEAGSCSVSSSGSESSVSEEKLSHVLEIIQSDSVRTKEVYKGLTYIRTKVLNHSEGVKLLQKVDYFKCLLKMLSHPNEDILNITISILGNLCNYLILNEEFRNEIGKNKISGKIVSILRKINKPHIQKRICRFIGNLAQSHGIGRELHVAGVTYAVVHVLNEAKDTELQHMAIRALRWLWHVDKHHGDMLRAGVVKAVSNHLPSSDPLVEKAVLRALVKFTQQRNVYTAEQICGTGDGYKDIIERLDQSVVAVLVCNLSDDPIARIELCKAGIVPAILNRLAEGKINSYLISGLCRMCRESMVRASLRLTHNGFSTLLSLLSEKKFKHFYPELLDAITQFNYDQTSLMMMVRCNLIGVLVEKLAEYSKAHCTGHAEAVASDWLGSPLSPASSWSPSPSPPPTSPPPSASDFSPCCSTPPSASDYSPRCATPPSDSDCSSDPPTPQERVGVSESALGFDACVLDVLSQLTYQGTPMRALASKTTITTLLDYLSRLPYPRFQSNFHKATRALTAILVCKHYWNMLLDDETVLEIHTRLCRPQHQDCWECKRLRNTGLIILRELGLTAQSGLGEGEIIYRLTGASNDARLTTALTIPHVIRQPNLLETLLYSHGGLAVLLNALSLRPEEAVPSFQSLFSTLLVINPQLTSQICSGCEVGNVRKEGNVLLMVDDGSTVSANREALSHACPVFEAMFRGGFKESTQSCVRLPDISASCLTHLTKVLPEYCSCALPKELPVLLEMISATDRFLLPELTSRIVGVVRNSALAPTTAAQIYGWALRTGQQYPLAAGLPLDVVSYLFASDILPTQRQQAVSAILASEDKESFLQDVSGVVRKALTAYTKTQREFNYRV